MFDTKRKAYKFRDGAAAIIFKQHLQDAGYFGATIRKSLPEYRGQAEPGYSVWRKARTIAEEMETDKLYKEVITWTKR